MSLSFSEGLQPGTQSPKLKWVGLFVLASVLVHGVTFGGVALFSKRQAPPPQEAPMEMVMVEVEPPPEPPPEEPEPPIKVATVKKAPVTPAPVDAPPPPTEEAPEPEKPAPLITGVSMSSTTSTGGFAAPVGNTTYGKVDSTARNPDEAKPYSAKKYSPIYQVDKRPSVSHEVKAPYTPEARRAGIEGSVMLAVTIDEKGNVTDVKLKKGLGYGLDEAAMAALRKFRFTAATKNGESVGTEIPYAYTFYLD